MKPKVFISATTGDLRSIRARIKEALLTLGCVPVEQTNFPPDYRSVADMLRSRIGECHVVVHIAGLRYGSEPQSRVPEEPRRSYTQMEYHIARELKKPVYTFVCGEDFPYDPCEPEEPEKRALQDAHRKKLLGENIHFEQIPRTEDLDRKVREIDYKKHVRWTTGMIATLAIVVLALAAAIGWLALNAARRQPPSESAARLFDAKDYAGAFHAYSRLSDANLDEIKYHRRVEESARRGRLEKPLCDRYTELVRQHPGSAVLHNYLGNAYLLMDSADHDGNARREYQAALRLDPNLSLPLMNLGIVALRSGQADEAQTLFTRYLAAFPDDAPGWVNLGLLYLGGVEKDPANAPLAGKAEAAFRRAIHCEPSLAPAYKGLARLCAAAGRKGDALNAYERSLALDYEQPQVRQQIELLAWETSGLRRPDDFATRSFSPGGTNAPPVVSALKLLGGGDSPKRSNFVAVGASASRAIRWPSKRWAAPTRARRRTNEARECFAKAGQLAETASP